MLVTVLGSAAGGLMVSPTPDQMEALQAGGSVATVGGHTVGAADGSAGLPLVGWSTEHGDLRIPHFFGLHGLQILPFLGWLASRRRRLALSGTRLAFSASASYVTFIAILTWQALRGQSIVAPDGATLLALAVWLAATVAAFVTVRGVFTPRQTLVASR
jgi:hypothetical protein